MLIPISWLKDFVDIKIPVEALAKKLSAAGLAVEKWTKEGDDYILDPEVTPNRPDWLSVLGVAREVAAVTGEKLKYKEIIVPIKKVKNPLPLNLKPNYEIVPRITSVIIKNVTVKPSPPWLATKIKQVGLRPINNLVDITNYILWLYGGLLHVFDYDKIRGHTMTVELSKGGEAFRSLDGLDYILPKNAIIIKDVGRVIDLLPLKGGENTASYQQTKTVLLHSVIVDPVLTRRTSQALGLRSDSSAVAEKGLDPNGTLRSVNHALALILELAGGEVASEIIDHKAHEFLPWEVTVTHEKIERILGIKIKKNKIINIFESLGLKCHSGKPEGRVQNPDSGVATLPRMTYKVTVPTWRNDIHIEEDLIEEVGRIIGYDNFPKTLPTAPTPTEKVAYARDYDLEYEVKQVLKGAGYSEIYTYSLVSESQLQKLGLTGIKILNPISKDYEYLRPQMVGNLLEAVKLNQANFSDIKIYELGKHYGEKEEYWLSGMQTGEKFYDVKGLVESLLTQFGVKFEIIPDDGHGQGHPGRSAVILACPGSTGSRILGYFGEIHPSLLAKFGVKGHVSGFTINYDLFEKLVNKTKKYAPVSAYPPIIEDITLTLPEKALVGELMENIKGISKLINNVELISIHERNYSFRITYLDKSKNLTDKDIEPIRKLISSKTK